MLLPRRHEFLSHVSARRVSQNDHIGERREVRDHEPVRSRALRPCILLVIVGFVAATVPGSEALASGSGEDETTSAARAGVEEGSAGMADETAPGATGDTDDEAPAEPHEIPPPPPRIHGDWEVRCEPLPDGTHSATDGDAREAQPCFLFQEVEDGETGFEILQVVVGHAPGRSRTVAVFIVPLDVFLPSGVLVQVDDGDPAWAQYQRCSPGGCQAVLPLDEELIDAFRRGEEATVELEDGRHTARRMPLSLMGFSAGLDAL